MGAEVTRRGFLQSVGISLGAILVASTPLKILEANAPKRLAADTAKKRPEPARRSGGATIRTIEFGDGTTIRISDWGDYPLWSRLDDTVIDVKSQAHSRVPIRSFKPKAPTYSKRAPHVKRPMYNKGLR